MKRLLFPKNSYIYSNKLLVEPDFSLPVIHHTGLMDKQIHLSVTAVHADVKRKYQLLKPPGEVRKEDCWETVLPGTHNETI